MDALLAPTSRAGRGAAPTIPRALDLDFLERNKKKTNLTINRNTTIPGKKGEKLIVDEIITEEITTYDGNNPKPSIVKLNYKQISPFIVPIPGGPPSSNNKYIYELSMMQQKSEMALQKDMEKFDANYFKTYLLRKKSAKAYAKFVAQIEDTIYSAGSTVAFAGSLILVGLPAINWVLTSGFLLESYGPTVLTTALELFLDLTPGQTAELKKSIDYLVRVMKSLIPSPGANTAFELFTNAFNGKNPLFTKITARDIWEGQRAFETNKEGAEAAMQRTADAADEEEARRQGLKYIPSSGREYMVGSNVKRNILVEDFQRKFVALSNLLIRYATGPFLGPRLQIDSSVIDEAMEVPDPEDAKVKGFMFSDGFLSLITSALDNLGQASDMASNMVLLGLQSLAVEMFDTKVPGTKQAHKTSGLLEYVRGLKKIRKTMSKTQRAVIESETLNLYSDKGKYEKEEVKITGTIDERIRQASEMAENSTLIGIARYWNIKQLDSDAIGNLRTLYSDSKSIYDQFKQVEEYYSYFKLSLGNAYAVHNSAESANPQFKKSYGRKMIDKLKKNSVIRSLFMNKLNGYAPDRWLDDLPDDGTEPSLYKNIRGTFVFFINKVSPQTCMGYVSSLVYDEIGNSVSSGYEVIFPMDRTEAALSAGAGVDDDDDDKNAKKRIAEEEYEQGIRDMRLQFIEGGLRDDALVNMMIEVKKNKLSPFAIDKRDMNVLESIWNNLQKKLEPLRKKGACADIISCWAYSTIAILGNEVLHSKTKAAGSSLIRGTMTSVLGEPIPIDVWGFTVQPIFDILRRNATNELSSKLATLSKELYSTMTSLYQEAYEEHVRKPFMNSDIIQCILKWRDSGKEWLQSAIFSRIYFGAFIQGVVNPMIDSVINIFINIPVDVGNKKLYEWQRSIENEFNIYDKFNPKNWNFILDNISQENFYVGLSHYSTAVVKQLDAYGGWEWTGEWLRNCISNSVSNVENSGVIVKRTLGYNARVSTADSWGSNIFKTVSSSLVSAAWDQFHGEIFTGNIYRASTVDIQLPGGMAITLEGDDAEDFTDQYDADHLKCLIIESLMINGKYNDADFIKNFCRNPSVIDTYLETLGINGNPIIRSSKFCNDVIDNLEAFTIGAAEWSSMSAAQRGKALTDLRKAMIDAQRLKVINNGKPIEPWAADIGTFIRLGDKFYRIDKAPEPRTTDASNMEFFGYKLTLVSSEEVKDKKPTAFKNIPLLVNYLLGQRDDDDDTKRTPIISRDMDIPAPLGENEFIEHMHTYSSLFGEGYTWTNYSSADDEAQRRAAVVHYIHFTGSVGDDFLDPIEYNKLYNTIGQNPSLNSNINLYFSSADRCSDLEKKLNNVVGKIEPPADRNKIIASMQKLSSSTPKTKSDYILDNRVMNIYLELQRQKKIRDDAFKAFLNSIPPALSDKAGPNKMLNEYEKDCVKELEKLAALNATLPTGDDDDDDDKKRRLAAIEADIDTSDMEKYFGKPGDEEHEEYTKLQAEVANLKEKPYFDGVHNRINNCIRGLERTLETIRTAKANSSLMNILSIQEDYNLYIGQIDAIDRDARLEKEKYDRRREARSDAAFRASEERSQRLSIIALSKKCKEKERDLVRDGALTLTSLNVDWNGIDSLSKGDEGASTEAFLEKQNAITNILDAAAIGDYEENPTTPNSMYDYKRGDNESIENWKARIVERERQLGVIRTQYHVAVTAAQFFIAQYDTGSVGASNFLSATNGADDVTNKDYMAVELPPTTGTDHVYMATLFHMDKGIIDYLSKLTPPTEYNALTAMVTMLGQPTSDDIKDILTVSAATYNENLDEFKNIRNELKKLLEKPEPRAEQNSGLVTSYLKSLKSLNDELNNLRPAIKEFIEARDSAVQAAQEKFKNDQLQINTARRDAITEESLKDMQDEILELTEIIELRKLLGVVDETLSARLTVLQDFYDAAFAAKQEYSEQVQSLKTSGTIYCKDTSSNDKTACGLKAIDNVSINYRNTRRSLARDPNGLKNSNTIAITTEAARRELEGYVNLLKEVYKQKLQEKKAAYTAAINTARFPEIIAFYKTFFGDTNQEASGFINVLESIVNGANLPEELPPLLSQNPSTSIRSQFTDLLNAIDKLANFGPNTTTTFNYGGNPGPAIAGLERLFNGIPMAEKARNAAAAMSPAVAEAIATVAVKNGNINDSNELDEKDKSELLEEAGEYMQDAGVAFNSINKLTSEWAKVARRAASRVSAIMVELQTVKTKGDAENLTEEARILKNLAQEAAANALAEQGKIEAALAAEAAVAAAVKDENINDSNELDEKDKSSLLEEAGEYMQDADVAINSINKLTSEWAKVARRAAARVSAIKGELQGSTTKGDAENLTEEARILKNLAQEAAANALTEYSVLEFYATTAASAAVAIPLNDSRAISIIENAIRARDALTTAGGDYNAIGNRPLWWVNEDTWNKGREHIKTLDNLLAEAKAPAAALEEATRVAAVRAAEQSLSNALASKNAANQALENCDAEVTAAGGSPQEWVKAAHTVARAAADTANNEWNKASSAAAAAAAASTSAAAAAAASEAAAAAAAGRAAADNAKMALPRAAARASADAAIEAAKIFTEGSNPKIDANAAEDAAQAAAAASTVEEAQGWATEAARRAAEVARYVAEAKALTQPPSPPEEEKKGENTGKEDGTEENKDTGQEEAEVNPAEKKALDAAEAADIAAEAAKAAPVSTARAAAAEARLKATAADAAATEADRVAIGGMSLGAAAARAAAGRAREAAGVAEAKADAADDALVSAASTAAAAASAAAAAADTARLALAAASGTGKVPLLFAARTAAKTAREAADAAGDAAKNAEKASGVEGSKHTELNAAAAAARVAETKAAAAATAAGAEVLNAEGNVEQAASAAVAAASAAAAAARAAAKAATEAPLSEKTAKATLARQAAVVARAAADVADTAAAALLLLRESAGDDRKVALTSVSTLTTNAANDARIAANEAEVAADAADTAVKAAAAAAIAAADNADQKARDAAAAANTAAAAAAAAAGSLTNVDLKFSLIAQAIKGLREAAAEARTKAALADEAARVAAEAATKVPGRTSEAARSAAAAATLAVKKATEIDSLTKNIVDALLKAANYAAVKANAAALVAATAREELEEEKDDEKKIGLLPKVREAAKNARDAAEEAISAAKNAETASGGYAEKDTEHVALVKGAGEARTAAGNANLAAEKAEGAVLLVEGDVEQKIIDAALAAAKAAAAADAAAEAAARAPVTDKMAKALLARTAARVARAAGNDAIVAHNVYLTLKDNGLPWKRELSKRAREAGEEARLAAKRADAAAGAAEADAKAAAAAAAATARAGIARLNSARAVMKGIRDAAKGTDDEEAAIRDLNKFDKTDGIIKRATTSVSAANGAAQTGDVVAALGYAATIAIEEGKAAEIISGWRHRRKGQKKEEPVVTPPTLVPTPRAAEYSLAWQPIEDAGRAAGLENLAADSKLGPAAAARKLDERDGKNPIFKATVNDADKKDALSAVDKRARAGRDSAQWASSTEITENTTDKFDSWYNRLKIFADESVSLCANSIYDYEGRCATIRRLKTDLEAVKKNKAFFEWGYLSNTWKVAAFTELKKVEQELNAIIGNNTIYKDEPGRDAVFDECDKIKNGVRTQLDAARVRIDSAKNNIEEAKQACTITSYYKGKDSDSEHCSNVLEQLQQQFDTAMSTYKTMNNLYYELMGVAEEWDKNKGRGVRTLSKDLREYLRRVRTTFDGYNDIITLNLQTGYRNSWEYEILANGTGKNGIYEFDHLMNDIRNYRDKVAEKHLPKWGAFFEDADLKNAKAEAAYNLLAEAGAASWEFIDLPVERSAVRSSQGRVEQALADEETAMREAMSVFVGLDDANKLSPQSLAIMFANWENNVVVTATEARITMSNPVALASLLVSYPKRAAAISRVAITGVSEVVDEDVDFSNKWSPQTIISDEQRNKWEKFLAGKLDDPILRGVFNMIIQKGKSENTARKAGWVALEAASAKHAAVVAARTAFGVANDVLTRKIEDIILSGQSIPYSVDKEDTVDQIDEKLTAARLEANRLGAGTEKKGSLSGRVLRAEKAVRAVEARKTDESFNTDSKAAALAAAKEVLRLERRILALTLSADVDKAVNDERDAMAREAAAAAAVTAATTATATSKRITADASWLQVSGKDNQELFKAWQAVVDSDETAATAAKEAFKNAFNKVSPEELSILREAAQLALFRANASKKRLEALRRFLDVKKAKPSPLPTDLFNETNRPAWMNQEQAELWRMCNDTKVTHQGRAKLICEAIGKLGGLSPEDVRDIGLSLAGACAAGAGGGGLVGAAVSAGVLAPVGAAAGCGISMAAAAFTSFIFGTAASKFGEWMKDLSDDDRTLIARFVIELEPPAKGEFIKADTGAKTRVAESDEQYSVRLHRWILGIGGWKDILTHSQQIGRLQHDAGNLDERTPTWLNRAANLNYKNSESGSERARIAELQKCIREHNCTKKDLDELQRDLESLDSLTIDPYTLQTAKTNIKTDLDTSRTWLGFDEIGEFTAGAARLQASIVGQGTLTEGQQRRVAYDLIVAKEAAGSALTDSEKVIKREYDAMLSLYHMCKSLMDKIEDDATVWNTTDIELLKEFAEETDARKARSIRETEDTYLFQTGSLYHLASQYEVAYIDYNRIGRNAIAASTLYDSVKDKTSLDASEISGIASQITNILNKTTSSKIEEPIRVAAATVLQKLEDYKNSSGAGRGTTLLALKGALVNLFLKTTTCTGDSFKEVQDILQYLVIARGAQARTADNLLRLGAELPVLKNGAGGREGDVVKPPSTFTIANGLTDAEIAELSARLVAKGFTGLQPPSDLSNPIINYDSGKRTSHVFYINKAARRGIVETKRGKIEEAARNDALAEKSGGPVLTLNVGLLQGLNPEQQAIAQSLYLAAKEEYKNILTTTVKLTEAEKQKEAEKLKTAEKEANAEAEANKPPAESTKQPEEDEDESDELVTTFAGLLARAGSIAAYRLIQREGDRSSGQLMYRYISTQAINLVGYRPLRQFIGGAAREWAEHSTTYSYEAIVGNVANNPIFRSGRFARSLADNGGGQFYNDVKNAIGNSIFAGEAARATVLARATGAIESASEQAVADAAERIARLAAFQNAGLFDNAALQAQAVAYANNLPLAGRDAAQAAYLVTLQTAAMESLIRENKIQSLQCELNRYSLMPAALGAAGMNRIRNQLAAEEAAAAAAFRAAEKLHAAGEAAVVTATTTLSTARRRAELCKGQPDVNCAGYDADIAKAITDLQEANRKRVPKPSTLPPRQPIDVSVDLLELAMRADLLGSALGMSWYTLKTAKWAKGIRQMAGITYTSDEANAASQAFNIYGGVVVGGVAVVGGIQLARHGSASLRIGSKATSPVGLAIAVIHFGIHMRKSYLSWSGWVDDLKERRRSKKERRLNIGLRGRIGAPSLPEEEEEVVADETSASQDTKWRPIDFGTATNYYVLGNRGRTGGYDRQQEGYDRQQEGYDRQQEGYDRQQGGGESDIGFTTLGSIRTRLAYKRNSDLLMKHLLKILPTIEEDDIKNIISENIKNNDVMWFTGLDEADCYLIYTKYLLPLVKIRDIPDKSVTNEYVPDNEIENIFFIIFWSSYPVLFMSNKDKHYTKCVTDFRDFAIQKIYFLKLYMQKMESGEMNNNSVVAFSHEITFMLDYDYRELLLSKEYVFASVDLVNNQLEINEEKSIAGAKDKIIQSYMDGTLATA